MFVNELNGGHRLEPFGCLGGLDAFGAQPRQQRPVDIWGERIDHSLLLYLTWGKKPVRSLRHSEGGIPLHPTLTIENHFCGHRRREADRLGHGGMSLPWSLSVEHEVDTPLLLL